MDKRKCAGTYILLERKDRKERNENKERNEKGEIEEGVKREEEEGEKEYQLKYAKMNAIVQKVRRIHLCTAFSQ